MTSPSDEARSWMKTARRLAFRVNLGSWLARFLPALAATSLGGAAILLVLRQRGLYPSRDPGVQFRVGGRAGGREQDEGGQ